VVLLARVRALLRREPRPLRTDVIEVADLAVDVAARRCTRAGRQIALTQRELALLEVLCRNREVVLTKRTLLDRVWGPDFQGGENVVEVYIGYLRRKVDDPFDAPLIETVRGHGYRISAR
jgi:DNA-binding response OmpR family regulator